MMMHLHRVPPTTMHGPSWFFPRPGKRPRWENSTAWSGSENRSPYRSPGSIRSSSWNRGPLMIWTSHMSTGHAWGGLKKPSLWDKDRLYRIPGELVDSTVLSIAVRVTDMMGAGGIYAPTGTMTLRLASGMESVSLTGEWKFLPTAIYRSSQFYSLGTDGKIYAGRPQMPVDVGPNTPAALYNAMIAPLVPYAVRGAIWYQGESNTGEPEFYRSAVPADDPELEDVLPESNDVLLLRADRAVRLWNTDRIGVPS